MRVTAVEIFSTTLEEPISFPLDNSDPTSRYSVKQILGLDAEEIFAKFDGWSLTSGEFYSMSMQSKEIVMRVALNPRFDLDESYSDIRDELYRAISANRSGLLEIHFRAGATTVARIFGSIKKMEASHFTNQPEVQLTFSCDDPMFRGVTQVVYSSADLGSTVQQIVPDTISTAPHGMDLKITFTGAAAQLTIQDDPTTPTWKFKVTPSGGFLSGDVLYLSSEFSNKYVYMVRSSTTTQLADKISPDSVWPTIFPGSNTFHFLEKANFNWNYIQFYPCFWGV